MVRKLKSIAIRAPTPVLRTGFASKAMASVPMERPSIRRTRAAVTAAATAVMTEAEAAATRISARVMTAHAAAYVAAIPVAVALTPYPGCSHPAGATTGAAEFSMTDCSASIIAGGLSV